AEREAAERVEPERLAHWRGHHAPRSRHGGGDRGQATEALRVALAVREGEGDNRPRFRGARADEEAAPGPPRVARRRRLAPERKQIQRGQRRRRCRGGTGVFGRGGAHLSSPFPCPSPQRGISLLASPSWSSTRPTTVSNNESSVSGFE